MIHAVGTVDFHYRTSADPNDIHYLKKKIQKKNKRKDKFKVLTVSEPIEKEDGLYVRVSCSFSILMDESKYCRTVDDYVGHVFPTLRERLSPHLIATKVYNLTKVH